MPGTMLDVALILLIFTHVQVALLLNCISDTVCEVTAGKLTAIEPSGISSGKIVLSTLTDTPEAGGTRPLNLNAEKLDVDRWGGTEAVYDAEKGRAGWLSAILRLSMTSRLVVYLELSEYIQSDGAIISDVDLQLAENEKTEGKGALSLVCG